MDPASFARLLRRGLLLVGVLAHPASIRAQSAAFEIPPDTISTLSTSVELRSFGQLGGVVIDAQGALFVANFHDRVWRIAPDGETRVVSRGMYGASGNTVDARGDLLQSNFNANEVLRISRITGEVEVFADEGLAGPVGITAGPDGAFYVVNCNAGSVSRISPDGDVSLFSEGPLFACPNGLVFNDEGDLFVVNFSNTQVVRITPDGTSEVFADIPGAGGNGHVTFAGGALYVTKFRGHTIHRVARDGSVSLVSGTGERGTTDGTAPGATHSFPNGITANAAGNTLFVTELVGPQGAGRTATEILVRRIRLVGIADVLADVPPASGVEGVERAWRAFHEQRPWSESTPDAIRTGFAFMSGGRVGEGIRVFELNAERHADQPAALFNLGEAYRYTGQMDRAAEQYRATLALDPEFPQAAERLELVSGG